MSATAHPSPSSRPGPHPAVDQLLALARNASRNVEEHDPIDYWYRLGQRNAYAHATAQLLTIDLGHDPFTIAERITTALDAGVDDVADLRSAAYGHTTPAPAASWTGTEMGTATLEWVGPKTFDSQHRHVRGLDRDYGMRWGQRGDQRISLRLDGDSATHGLLYAYDPTWDEYAVLSPSAPRAAVDRAFARATGTDIHMTAESFTALVSTCAAAAELDRRDLEPVAQVQL